MPLSRHILTTFSLRCYTGKWTLFPCHLPLEGDDLKEAENKRGNKRILTLLDTHDYSNNLLFHQNEKKQKHPNTNTISFNLCNRKCQVKWWPGKNEKPKWLALSLTGIRHVEMSDKALFCPEIPHPIFKPGNWLVISILNTSCPGAQWWQPTAKFSSCLHLVNWVIHGIKNSIKR